MAINNSGEHMPLTTEQVAALKANLLDKRQRVMAQVQAAARSETADALRVADEMDLASVGYEQAFEFRLRDREAVLIKKIDKALERIDEDEYDECENCGSPIGYQRLLARPEARFCIDCKEEQEKVEKMYEKRRKRMTSFE